MNENIKKDKGQHYAVQPIKDHIYEEFIFWSALPASERQKTGAETLLEFAAQNGVHRNTLGLWKQRQDYQDRVDSLRKQWGREMTAYVFDGWKLACMKGSAQAIELWLSYFEGFNKKQVIEQHVKVEVTADDIRNLINELPREEQKEFYGLLANLADRVKYHRSTRKTVHSIGDSRPSEPKSELPRALPRPTYNIPQGTSDGRTYEVSYRDKESVRETMERNGNASDN